jgi:hypothetical protein
MQGKGVQEFKEFKEFEEKELKEPEFRESGGVWYHHTEEVIPFPAFCASIPLLELLNFLNS